MSSSFPGDIGEEAKTQSAVWQVDSQHDCANRKRKSFSSKRSLQPDHGRRSNMNGATMGTINQRCDWTRRRTTSSRQGHPSWPRGRYEPREYGQPGPPTCSRPRIDDPHPRRPAEAETRRTLHCARGRSEHEEQPLRTTENYAIKFNVTDHRAATFGDPF